MLLTIYLIGYAISLLLVIVAVAYSVVQEENYYNSFTGSDVMYVLIVVPLLSWVFILLLIFMIIFKDIKNKKDKK